MAYIYRSLLSYILQLIKLLCVIVKAMTENSWICYITFQNDLKYSIMNGKSKHLQHFLKIIAVYPDQKQRRM